jgi:hypothetical protein
MKNLEFTIDGTPVLDMVEDKIVKDLPNTKKFLLTAEKFGKDLYIMEIIDKVLPTPPETSVLTKITVTGKLPLTIYCINHGTVTQPLYTYTFIDSK